MMKTHQKLGQSGTQLLQLPVLHNIHMVEVFFLKKSLLSRHIGVNMLVGGVVIAVLEAGKSSVLGA